MTGTQWQRITVYRYATATVWAGSPLNASL